MGAMSVSQNKTSFMNTFAFETGSYILSSLSVSQQTNKPKWGGGGSRLLTVEGSVTSSFGFTNDNSKQAW